MDYRIRTVERITQSSVGQATNELIKGFTKSELQLPYMVAMQITEIKAEEEINAAVGLSFIVGRFFDFSSAFDFKTNVSKLTR